MKLLTALVLSAHFLWLNAETEGDVGTFLASLGSVEGKTYYYDQTIKRDWPFAKRYCEGLGMKLATIKSDVELQFLKSRYNSSGFTGAHWVALRDSRLPRALSWDDTETQIENFDSIVWVDFVGAVYQICGLYRSGSPSRFEMWPCVLDSYRLCEQV